MPRFSRIEKVIGKTNLKLLQSKKVLILGCGGVGGYVCEALARSGVGNLILVDYDTIDESNINRQIIALDSTLGKLKVDVLAERVLDINKACKVDKCNLFVNKDNIYSLLNKDVDFIVDACDCITTKKEIIKICLEKKIPFISCMGTGNKLDPSKLEIIDIRKTVNDPLARIIRKYVRDLGIKEKIMVLSSREVPIKIQERTPGSLIFVPATAGLLIANYIIRQWVEK